MCRSPSTARLGQSGHRIGLLAVWVSLLVSMLLTGCGGGGGSGPSSGGASGGPLTSATSSKVYVVNAGNASTVGSVSVIDIASRSVVHTLSVGIGPVAVAVDNTHNRAYVVTADVVAPRHTLVTIDTTSDTVLFTQTLGTAPTGVAVDPATQTVYVSQGALRTLAVIDAVAHVVSAVIPLGADPSVLALDGAHQRLYVLHSSAVSVSVIDTTSRSVTATISLPGGTVPTALAVDPTTAMVYVNALASAQVVVIDGLMQAVVRTDAVGFLPSGLAVSAFDNRVYAANALFNSVTQIDPYSGPTATANFSGGTLPKPQALAVDDLAGELYIANQGTNNVTVVTVAGFAASNVLATIPVGAAPQALAVVVPNQALPVAPAVAGLGVRWVVQTPTAASGDLLSVTTDASRFVAVGRGGLIRTSTDGEVWTTQTSGTTQDLNQVAWLNGQFIAVGQAGTLLSSPDGLSWTARSSGVAVALNGLTWGAGSYWVVGQGGTLLSSPDGVTWSPRTLGITADLLAIAIDPASGRMVATGAAATVLSSADSGATWGGASTNAYIAATRNPGTASAQPARLDAVVWTGSQFVASGGLADPLSGLAWSVVMRSADAQTWTAVANGASYGGGRLSWVNGQLLQAVPEMNGFRSSADAVTWSYRNNHPVLLQAQDFKPVQVAYAKGLYVAVGPLQGPNLGAAAPTLGMGARFCVGTSLDGLDWVHSAPGSAKIRSSVAFDGQRFVSRVQTYDLDWSADGATDLVRSPLGLVNPTMVTAGTGSGGIVRFLNGRYVMPDNQGRIASSTDGVHWSESFVPGLSVNGQMTSVTWGKGLYVAVGQYATIATSPDAVTWTVVNRLPGTLTNNVLLNEVVFLNGRFLAVGQGGLLMSSSDGITWSTSHPQAPNVNTSLNTLTMNSSPHQPNDFRSISEGNGVLVIAGLNSSPNTQAGAGYLNLYPSVLTSADGGQTWTERADSPEGLKDGLSIPGVVGYERVLFGGGHFYLVAKNRSSAHLGGVVLSSADGLRWVDRTPPGIATLAYDFNDIAFGNNRLMVVGGSSNGGLVLTSP